MSRRSDAGRGALEDLQESRLAVAAVAPTTVEEIEVILERLRRLRYDHNNPERFHAERSDIAGALGGVIRRMREASSAASVPPIPRQAVMATGVRSTERRPYAAHQRPVLHLRGQG